MGRSNLFAAPKKVMNHGDFIKRIRKSLYYGVGTAEADMEVSLPFAEYAAEMFSKPHRGHSLHRLSCVAAAKVQATPCSLIMALIYLDRLHVIDPGYSCRITPQELFVVSLMISTKYYAGHDERFYLEDWAEEGSMTEDRLKKMELEFLSTMDWNIYISNEHFFDKLKAVERTLAERQGLRRGWLTYSELTQMLPGLVWTKFILNSLSILVVSYAASVITLAGAFFIASQIPGTLWHRGVDTALETPSTSFKLEHQASAPNTSEPTSGIDGEVIDFISNVEMELLELNQQYCVKTRLNKMERLRFVQLFGNFHEIKGLSTKYKAQNWLNIKTKYSSYQETSNHWITVCSVHLGNYWNHARNGSVFWKVNTKAIMKPFWPQVWSKLM